MNLIDWLQAERGRAARMAREAEIAGGYLSQMATGIRPVPPGMVPMLERESQFAVRRWDLRPDDWHRIWPELINTEGAPAVPALTTEVSDAA